MPKRKWNNELDGRNPKRRPRTAPDLQATAEERINAGLKELTRALKQAKGFERQRLGKRLKESSKADDSLAVERINAEITALKALESRADLAQQHLFKVLLRTKSIKESPHLPPFVRLPAKRDDDSATSNVTSRLFRSKAVKKVVDTTLGDVKEALDLVPQGKKSLGKSNERLSESGKGDPALPNDRVGAVRDSSSPFGSDEAPSGDDERSANYSDASGSEDNWAGFEDRIVASSDESDAGDDDGDEEDTRTKNRTMTKRPLIYMPSASQSPSPEPSLSASLSPSMSPSPEPRAVRTPAARTRSDAFLPSLTMGGYLSNSESEAEDLDALGPPRKNRRGQRARQQIWEKKYGGKAKHLNADSKDRNAGWDAKRGAMLAGEKRRPGQPWRREKAPGIASGSNEIAVKPRKVVKKSVDDKPLHPSWEAKKLAKEKQMSSAAFVGKKITFD